MGSVTVERLARPGPGFRGPVGRCFAVLVVLMLVAGATACGSSDQPDTRPLGIDDLPPADAIVAQSGSWAPSPSTVDGFKVIATAGSGQFRLSTTGGERQFLPGVNLGSTVPGRFPGEVGSIGADQYRSWLEAAGRTGARVVRVYTILPPAFYDELDTYNRAHPDVPLYLMQGVYFTDEGAFYETGDLWDPRVGSPFRQEITDADAAVSGRLERHDAMPGRATGSWNTDVSPYLIAWLVGIELDPDAVQRNDQTNAERPYKPGRYIAAIPGATATERAMAEALDHVATLEASRGRSSPVAFVNWPTTDPLSHPDEPLEGEDMVPIDANHVLATKAWPGGVFASYHAYPYYPDFQRYEPGLQVADSDGRIDPYRAYLRALREHHDEVGMPTLITEFGVPSSVGSSHNGPLGRDQGGHSEREAMAINAELLQVIAEEGLSAGLVFMLADEWFKFTWNTIDLQVPGNRRPMWPDALTNEENFGLIANDPGDRSGLVLGDGVDWGDSSDSDSVPPLRDLLVDHDEGYVYLRARFDGTVPSRLTVGFDVDPAFDGGGLPGTVGAAPKADVAIRVKGSQAVLSSAAGRDPVSVLYGVRFGYPPTDPSWIESGSGRWVPYRQIINRPNEIASTGKHNDVELFELGKLIEAPTDPEHRSFDPHGQFWRTDSEIQFRIPWSMLGIADPSSRNGLRLGADGTISTFPIEHIGLSVAVEGSAGISTSTFSWEGWNVVTWRPRIKQGVIDYAKTANELASDPSVP